jgi:hypothetical protein
VIIKAKIMKKIFQNLKMTRIIFIICSFFYVNSVYSFWYGQISIESCYQKFTAPVNGGTFKVIGGTTIYFYSTNLGDFNSVDVTDHVTNVYITTLHHGDPFYIESDRIYEFTPNIIGGINPQGWGPVILESEAPDIHIPPGCLGFNQLVDFGVPFYQMCDWDMEVFNPYTGITIAHEMNGPGSVNAGQFTISSGDFCSPSSGISCLGAAPCLPGVKVTLRIKPCVFGDTTCPPIEVSRYVTFCCNNCQPYEPVIPTQVIVNKCFGIDKEIIANCPIGTASKKWYLSPDLTTEISTENSLWISLNNNPIYVLQCLNSDGCLISETIYQVNTSSPPVAYFHSITACYGQNITIFNPCGLENSLEWINPVGSVGDLELRVWNDEGLSLQCKDPNGCLLGIHEYGIDVIEPAAQLPIHIWDLCSDEDILLDNYYPAVIEQNCTWKDGLGNSVIGNIPFRLNPGTHTYELVCDDINGCRTIHTFFLHILDCTSGEPNGGGDRSGNSSASHEMKLYPNPAYTEVNVAIDIRANESYDIQVRDVLGKELIGFKNVSEKQLWINISNLPAGIYQVEVHIEGEIIEKRLVKR